jgi:hypothetical protein
MDTTPSASLEEGRPIAAAKAVPAMEVPTLNAAHRPERQAQRWYAPDYRRRLRDAGAFRSLSTSAQVVLAALGDRANAAGVAWPAVETTARDYGIAESTVRRALGEL